MSAEDLKNMYGIDAKILAGFSVHMPLMNVKANEIGVFQVKDKKDVDSVKAGIKKRAEAIQKEFETYLQDQYKIAQDYRVVVKGDYVLFAISEQADDLEKAFSAALAAK